MDLLKSAANAFNSLNERMDEMRDIYSQRADKKGRLNISAHPDLFDDLSAALSIDCEGAKTYFSKENENIPSEVDLHSLTFEEFYELFGVWLQENAQENPEENQQQEEEGQEENAENENNQEFEQNEEGQDNQDNEENDNQENNGEDNQQDTNAPEAHNESLKTHKGKKPSKASGVSNYEKNKQIYDEMLRNHMQDFESLFYHFLGEDSGEERLSLAGCFEFFKECFQVSEVDLKERKDAKGNFFNVPENQQNFAEIAQGYLQSKPKEGEDQDSPANNEAMSFNECFDFLDYWLRTDFYLVLVDHSKEVTESSVFKTLMETIEKYEKLIEESQNEVEKDILQTTVDTLKNKLAQLKTPKAQSEALDNPQAHGRNKSMDREADLRRKEAKRNVALKEIFDFYCTQQLNVGRSSTFDRLGRLAGTINIGTFKVFLTTFKLSIDHLKLLELYKKSAGLDENLQFHEFMDLINKVASKVDLVTETKTHEPNYEIMKNYKPDSYKKDPTYRNFKKEDDKRREEDMKTIIKKTRKQYLDYNKRDAEKLEEVWEHMGLHNNMYKSYMGMIQLPFNSQDKENFRIPPGSLKYKFRTQAMDGKSIAEIKDEVNKRNEMRKLVKDLKSMEKILLMSHKPSVNTNRNHERSSIMNDASYIKKNYTRTTNKGNGPDMSKMTMKKIGGMGYGEVKRVDEQFDPNDLIDENDEEDNIYLAEYNLSAEKKKVEELVETEKKKVEEYGKLKKPAKGFATNGRYGTGFSTPGKRNTVGELTSETQSVGYVDYNSNSGRPSAHNTSNLISTRATNGNINTIVHSKSSKLIPGVPAQYPEYDYVSPQGKNAKNMYASPQKSTGQIFSYGTPKAGYYPEPGPQVANNGYYQPKSPGYNYALDRANQVENDLRRREQEMIKSVMSIQDKQVKKGLKAVGK